MARRKSSVTGPMNVQPVEHRSIRAAVQSPVLGPPGATQTAAAKERASGEDAVRAAKAKISRHNSLRKQRQFQKDQKGRFADKAVGRKES
jgi:hypothetical protein